MIDTFEAIVIFRGALPSATTIQAIADGRASFDASVVGCSPETLENYLDDPGQPLSAVERNQLASARAGLKLISQPTERLLQLAHFTKLAPVLFEHGACAIVFPMALRILGSAQLARAALEPTEVERWLALFVHHHAVAQGEHVWLHTHGMQYFGLPDVECVERPQVAGETIRAIRAVLHRLVVGPPLRLGDLVEHGSEATRFRLVPSIPIEGHAFGSRDAVRLHRAA